MKRRAFMQLAAAGGAALALPLLWRRRGAVPSPIGSRSSDHPAAGSRRFCDARGNFYDVFPTENRVEFRMPNGTLRAQVNEGLRAPMALAFDREGSVMILEGDGARVRRFDRDARPLGKFGERGGGAGQLRWPHDLVSVDDGVVIADTHNHRLQLFDGDGRARGTIGKLGFSGAELNGPSGVALGPERTLFVADTGNARVQVYALDGGAHLDSFGRRGGEAGQFRAPRGLRFDAGGRLHVVDAVGGWVSVFDARRQFVDCYRPANPDGTPGTPAWLSNRADGFNHGRPPIRLMSDAPNDGPTLASLSADHFRPLVGQEFVLEVVRGQPLPATLTDVDERLRQRRPADTRAPFSLMLRVPAGSPASQGTHLLSHASLGRWELFMTPMQPSADGGWYQIVFA